MNKCEGGNERNKAYMKQNQNQANERTNERAIHERTRYTIKVLQYYNQRPTVVLYCTVTRNYNQINRNTVRKHMIHHT